MGYAMFAARKIMLTDSINMTNLELTKISNQLMDLADLGAAVSDGDISAFDIASCQQAGLTCSAGWDYANTCVSKYGEGEYYAGLATAEGDAREHTGLSWGANLGGAGIGAAIGAILGFGVPGALIGGALGGIVGNQCSAKTQARNQYVDQYNEQYEEKMRDQIARELQEQIAEMENELEKRQANLETKIQAYQADLQAVEQAESKGIESATPKYAGV